MGHNGGPSPRHVATGMCVDPLLEMTVDPEARSRVVVARRRCMGFMPWYTVGRVGGWVDGGVVARNLPARAPGRVSPPFVSRGDRGWHLARCWSTRVATFTLDPSYIK